LSFDDGGSGVGTRALLSRLCAASSLVPSNLDLARATTQGNYSQFYK
jgi:hypothetical protein